MNTSSAHDTTYIIHNISIDGNKVTKEKIILHELEFSINDTIRGLTNLHKRLEMSQNNLMNTLLFHKVTLSTEIKSYDSSYQQFSVHVFISVTERWYIWPIPFFQVEERNLNDWLSRRQMVRMSYGIYYLHDNLRGRREQLLIGFKTGFNQAVMYKYKKPFIDKKQTIGITTSFSFDNTKNVFYNTLQHKEQLAIADKFLINQKELTIEMMKRHKLKQYYQIKAGYMHATFDDTLFELNQHFIDDHKKDIQALLFRLYLKWDYRDYVIFPLKGYYFDIEIQQQGLGIFPFENVHITTFSASLKFYQKIFSKTNLFYTTGVFGKFRPDEDRSYYFRNKLGYYNTYVRGYENFVIDAKHFILWKHNLIFPLLTHKYIRLPFIKNEKFTPLPLNFYIHGFFDAGYTWNPYYSPDLNPLGNKMLFGYGLGITFITYYDGIFRIELSRNDLGRYSFALQVSAPL